MFIELGCGGGNFLPYFHKKYKNLSIYGMDKSIEGCKLTLERMKGKLDRTNIIEGDILKYSAFNKKFDIVFSFGLIEHFDEPKIALEKHVNLLKKDGILLCFVPNLIGIQGKILSSKNWFLDEDGDKSNEYIFGMKKITIEQLEKWANSQDLFDKKIKPVGGILPMFIIDTIPTIKKPKLRRAKLFHRYILMAVFILLNIPFLFRLNSKNLSPYLILVGKKI